MKKGMLVLVAASIVSLPFAASASSFTGKSSAVRVSAGASGPARVSVLVGNHGSPCAGNPQWFAYENANPAAVEVWTSLLQDAQNTGHTVTIQGTGVCDGFGVEGINYIDSK